MCFTNAYFTVKLYSLFRNVVTRYQVLFIVTPDLFTCDTLHVNRNLNYFMP